MHDQSRPSESTDNQASPPRVWVYPLSFLFVCAVAVVLFIFFFDALSTVLLGGLAAAIVACALNPLVRYIPGPRGLAAALLGLGLIAAVTFLILAFSWPLTDHISNELKEWPQTKVRIDELLDRWSTAAGLREAVTVDALLANVGRFFAGERAPGLFGRGADLVLAILIWLVFIFIGSIFLLADPNDRLLKPALRIITPRWRPQVEEMLDNLSRLLRRWVIGTLISMCIVFIASSIGFFSIGLKFALPLALLAGLCEIVPTVGPACAMLLAFLFGATQSTGVAVGVMFTYAVIQSLEAYLILPMIMRGAVKIHPAVTLFSVVLWGKIFGVPGLMLAIPINLTIASLLEYLYIRRREPVAAALASPVSAPEGGDQNVARGASRGDERAHSSAP